MMIVMIMTTLMMIEKFGADGDYDTDNREREIEIRESVRERRTTGYG